MLSKRILVLVSLLLISFLLISCGITTPDIVENQKPIITTPALPNATVGTAYTATVDAYDPDGDALTYSLISTPSSGMKIGKNTGLITWNYPVAGKYRVEVEVSDGILSVTKPFNMSVADRIPMEIIVDSSLTFTVGEPYWFTVKMIANSDLGKLVVASFKVPTSSGGVVIEGILETDVGSDVTFTQASNVFRTDVFTMKNVTANFRGTFDKAGTYLTTVEVRTHLGGTLLRKKDITIVVEPALAVGDSYGGGIVAYILQDVDPGYIAGQQHGLIAATENQSTGVAWAKPAYQTIAVDGTSTDYGEGKNNTNKIVAQHGGVSTNYAAGVARAYTGGGHDDWFLPSWDELDKLYDNRAVIDGFVDINHPGYWSSSEVDAKHAWMLWFFPGSVFRQNCLKLDSGRSVRAVRYF